MAVNSLVSIRGAGVVGQTLALLLARQGLSVHLITQDASASEAHRNTPPDLRDLRAYALNDLSCELLRSVGAWPLSPLPQSGEFGVCPIHAMRVYGSPQSAQGLRWQDVAKQEPVKPLAHMVDAGPLLHRLEHAIAAESRIQCIHHADVVCASQTPGLTVVCEGKASVSRERYGFEQIKEPYHYQAIVARLLSHLPHEGVAWQWFSPQGILALLPLPGTQDRPGHELALVWSVPNQKAAHLMALTSIPTAFVEALHADMSPDGYAALGGLTLTSHVAHWPLQRALVTHAVAPGVVLLGDAAHTVHPLSGQGLNLGLGDVKALSEVLAQRPYWQSLGDWHLLRRYERARRLSWALTAASTDFLHHFFALGGVFSKASLCLPWLFEYVPGVKSVQQSLIHAARRGFAFH